MEHYVIPNVKPVITERDQFVGKVATQDILMGACFALQTQIPTEKVAAVLFSQGVAVTIADLATQITDVPAEDLAQVILKEVMGEVLDIHQLLVVQVKLMIGKKVNVLMLVQVVILLIQITTETVYQMQHVRQNFLSNVMVTVWPVIVIILGTQTQMLITAFSRKTLYRTHFGSMTILLL